MIKVFSVKTILIFFLGIKSFDIQAQSALNLSNQEPKSNELVTDQVFVQTDRNLYYPSDTIFFQAYIKDKLSGEFLSGSNTLYVKLYNEQNELVDDSRFRIDQFSATGWLTIPQQAKTGKYRFVAFTSLMQNNRPKEVFLMDLRVGSLERNHILTDVSFDKETYLPGDTVEATVKLTNAKKNLIPNLKINCRLLSGQAVLKKDKSRTNDDGISVVKFKLPDTLSVTPKFEIKTERYNDTIINQLNIPFKKEYINFCLLPEGGTLISGVEQKIGFNATDINGEPIKIEGLLKNKNGHILDTIKSGIYGPGTFICNPENGMFVELINGNFEKKIWPLPKLDSSFLCLSVKHLGNRLIVIDTKSNKNSLDSALIKVTINSQEFLSKKFRIEKLKRITIMTDPLPSCLLTITLFDPMMKPVAERLVYVNADKHLRFDIKSDSIEHNPGKETQLSISATDSYGNNEPCIFSISTVDSISGHDARLFAPEIAYSLNYHPYLAKNLPAKALMNGIENLDNEQLDLLMMVYGWSRFNWNSANYNLNSSETIDYENIVITLPVLGANKKLELIELDKLNVRKIKTDKNGRFILPFDSLLNTTRWISIIPDRSSKIKYNGVITMQIPENEKFMRSKDFFTDLPIFQQEAKSMLQNQQNMLQNDSAIEIQEVTIKANAKREYLNEYEAMFIGAKSFGYEELWSYKRMQDAITWIAHPYKITDNAIILQRTNPFSFSIYRDISAALIVLDGNPLEGDGWQIVKSISPSDLSSITVISESTDGYSLYGDRGLGGVIFINSMYLNKDPKINQRYREWMKKNKHDIMFKPTNIYRVNKEFYNPGKAELDNNPKFQIRQTLFWKSYVYYNGKDPAIIKFINPKHAGTIMITINGVSTHNLLGTGKLSYKVQ